MPKHLVLDYYGVVETDSLRIWLDEHYAGSQSIVTQIDDISRAYDLDAINLDEYFAQIAAVVNRPQDEVEQEMSQGIVVNRPLLALVDELREGGVAVSLLSNDGSSLRQTLQAQGLEQCFDNVFLSGELKLVKPDPQIFTAVTETLATEPRDIIFFDDKQANVDGARSVGWQAHVYESVAQVRRVVAETT